jgi:hypothetical protein
MLFFSSTSVAALMSIRRDADNSSRCFLESEENILCCRGLLLAVFAGVVRSTFLVHCLSLLLSNSSLSTMENKEKLPSR